MARVSLRERARRVVGARANQQAPHRYLPGPFRPVEHDGHDVLVT